MTDTYRYGILSGGLGSFDSIQWTDNSDGGTQTEILDSSRNLTNITSLSASSFVSASSFEVDGQASISYDASALDFSNGGAGAKLSTSAFSSSVELQGSSLYTAGAAKLSGGLSASSARVADLTDTRIVYAGPNGELQDSNGLTYSGGNLSVSGNLSGSGDLQAGGNADISGTLAVTGVSTLGTVTASAGYFTNNLKVDNTFEVAGTVSASGQADFGGAMNVSGAMSVTGTTNLAVLSASAGRFSSDLTVIGNLNVQGTTTTVDSTQVQIGDRIIELNTQPGSGDAGLFVQDALNSQTGSLLYDVSTSRWMGGVSGSESILVDRGSNETITGRKSFNSLTASNADINGGTIDGTAIGEASASSARFTTISGSGAASFGNSVTIAGATTVNNTLSASGQADFGNAMNVAGATAISDTLFVNGAVTLSSSISASGQANFAQSMTVAGATTINSTLSASDQADFGGAMNVAGAMDVSGAATFNNTLSASGQADFGGAMNVAGAVTISSATTISSSLSASGEANFGGAMTIAGALTASSGADMNSNRIVNVSDPSNAQDAATKAYVDAQLTSQVVTISSSNGTGSVDLDSEAIFFSGTTNEIDVSFNDTTNVIQYGLPQDVTIAQDLTVARNLVVSGNVDLGDDSGDTISANGRFDTALLPTGSMDIGSENARWGDIYATNVYTGDLHMKNERGDWTLFEESDHIRIRNNATGQEFSLNMTPIEE